MLILPHSCFLQVPKTAGTWARSAIKASGIECKDYIIDGNPHLNLANCPYPEKKKIAFVRHPLSFYRSFWQFKMKVGWDFKNVEEQKIHSSDFHVFIRNVLDKLPSGFCETYYSTYVGPAGNEIEFIGKYENLVEDLIRGLQQADESFDETAIRNLPPKNVSDRLRFPAEYTRELKEAVLISEWKALERFDYL